MKTQDSWGDAPYLIFGSQTEAKKTTVNGRDRWALECLIAAGEKGCTPIDHPGPRWSGYVFNLRSMGFEIETVREQHSGPFPGSHARYVLRSIVERAEAGACNE